MAKENKKHGKGWRIIAGGHKNRKSTSEENEIFNELKKYLAMARQRLKGGELSEFTFVITTGTMRIRETVVAASRAEAEKIIRDMYPFANAELLDGNAED